MLFPEKSDKKRRIYKKDKLYKQQRNQLNKMTDGGALSPRVMSE